MVEAMDQKYLKMFEQMTSRQILFPEVNQGSKPIIAFQSIQIMQSQYPFKCAHQIDNNIELIIHQMAQETFKQDIQSTIQVKHEWPQSCIGLILCEHHQNNQTFYVYGTGTLIYNDIVLTSAQNVYCRRLHTEYVNIRFITGVNGNKCSGIYDVKRVHYPKEYTMQQGHENHNFAVLQLYDNLYHTYGFVGWNSDIKSENQQLIAYGYTYDSKAGFFKLQQITGDQKLDEQRRKCSGNGVLVKVKVNTYQIIGLNIFNSQSKEYLVLSEQIRKIVNQWLEQTIIDLDYMDIDVQGYKNLRKINQPCLTTISLHQNKIGTQGCKYLSQVTWTRLNTIDLLLEYNNIDAQGCKYLSQTNWTNLNTINLMQNQIGAQGCKYLSQAKWKHLSIIKLLQNNIDAQGCKYLSQAVWPCLTMIYLASNKIDAQGCKYLSQAVWPRLTMIYLDRNSIDAQGCKYLTQANWKYMTSISVNTNNICAQGCKYLTQANWKYLTSISLNFNNIGRQGYKYLSQTNWKHLSMSFLKDSNISVIDYAKLKQLWINAIIH